jgi:hypothetical protein
MRTGSQVAVRDARRLQGEYVLQEKAVMEGPEFPDRLAGSMGHRCCGIFHWSTVHTGSRISLPEHASPRGGESLVTGRCGSATFIAHFAGKSMGNMMDLGQGAGVCAALAARAGVLVRDVDVAEAQEILRGMDVPI